MLRPRSGRSRLFAAQGRRRHATSPLGGLAGLAALTLVVGLTGLTGCKEPTGPEREISGARLFSQNCARCHGADGKGAADAPAGTRDLTDPGHMSMLTDQQIKRVIQMGKPPNMPAFGRQFAEPSIKVLVAFVRDLSAPKPTAGAAEGDAP